MQRIIQALGDAAAPAVAFLMMVQGRLAHRAGRTIEAQQLLARAAEFARWLLIESDGLCPDGLSRRRVGCRGPTRSTHRPRRSARDC